MKNEQLDQIRKHKNEHKGRLKYLKAIIKADKELNQNDFEIKSLADDVPDFYKKTLQKKSEKLQEHKRKLTEIYNKIISSPCFPLDL